MDRFFIYLDGNKSNKKGKILNQLLPIFVCAILFVAFMGATYFFIQYFLNQGSKENIQILLKPEAVFIGFFLYFVTAIDYALIIGRMQDSNPGSKSRFIMNVFTCLGCFVGVSLVLFLWGFAKEIPWLIVPILIFAGSVMIKLAYEGSEYFENATSIPSIIKLFTKLSLKVGYSATRIFTYWMPELGKPSTERLSDMKLAQWSFFLPFIIGLDDLIGYMGAMTIYNVFSLLFGIYLADIVIDLLIFISPKITKKLVENALISLLASYAFLYLAYKSYKEAIFLLEEHYDLDKYLLLFFAVVFVGIILVADGIVLWLKERKLRITPY